MNGCTLQQYQAETVNELQLESTLLDLIKFSSILSQCVTQHTFFAPFFMMKFHVSASLLEEIL